jgi:Flagellar protein FliT
MGVEHDLLALAWREHALAAGGGWEHFDAIAQQREELVAQLPPQVADPAQRAVLEQVVAVQAQAAAAMRARMDEIGSELSRLRVGRATVRGYGSPEHRPPPMLDTAG